ncbi:SDR family oxidoreductase [Mycobacterium hubeiense]|uniref:SDR family oxidoreductase n=1 Tax=Mycobacterium hubeiense TaxID=1867256 RepID=UPI000C7F2AE1|nr:NmrA family NAD(P)-binding protein [Mycobacterium sp. QGD 101]
MSILVTGATGNIGRRIVDHLIDLGVSDIRALTTNPAKAKLPEGVTPITGYLGKPETLPAALDGVDRMYLAPFPPTLDVALDLIKRADVEYVVALSGGAHWQQHTDTIAASGITNTQLGPGEFLENFTIWAEQIKTTRTVREPYPDMVEAPISMDDIARVATALLVKPEESHYGQMYELTGPEALSRKQIAEQIGVGIGVEVTFEQCSREEAEAALRPIMGDETGWYLDLMAEAEPQHANQLVAELTGTPAMSVAQWAAANAEMFR